MLGVHPNAKNHLVKPLLSDVLFISDVMVLHKDEASLGNCVKTKFISFSDHFTPVVRISFPVQCWGPLFPVDPHVIGGSLELPMWLTDGFLVTFLEGGGDCVHTR